MADDSLYPTKYCRTCKEHKPLAEFYKDGRKRDPDAVRARCKACELASQYNKRSAHYRCEPGFKICTACGDTKALGEFYPQKNKRDGVRSHCISCIKILRLKTNNIAVRKYRAQHKEKLDAARRAYYREHIERAKTNDQVRHRRRREKKWEKLGASPRPEACEICNCATTLVVDHCHRGGQFRGWLCNRCNLTLGQVQDKTELLRRMISYLESRSAMDTPAN